MNAIVKQFGFPHLMPLHKARCIVMRESTVNCFDLHVNHNNDTDIEDDNDVSQTSSRKNISTRHACHVVMKALRDNVDPYDYDCDSDTDDDDDDYSNASLIMEEDTSCSSSESSVSDDEEASSQPDHRMVRFCAPLVTASYVRPVTTIEEKYELYYTEREYREFRRNYVLHTRSQQKHQQQRVDRLQQQQQDDDTANTTNMIRKPSVVQFHVDVITEIHTTPTIDNPTELYYSRMELQGFLDDFVASLAKGVV